MKKLLTIIFIFFVAYSFGQTPYFFDRSSGVNTVQDVRSAAKYNFYIPRLTDTTLSGGVDTLGAILYVISGSKQGVWYRDSVSTGGHKWSRLAGTTETYWTLNSSNLYPNSTSYNVGIGTTSPTHKIDVVSGTGTLFFDGTRLGLYDDATRNNVLVGQLTGQSLSTSYNDAVFIGGSAGRFATGNYNIGIGTSALQNADNQRNVAIGYKSLNLTDSTENTALGYLSGLQNYGTRNIAIGSQSGNYQTLGSGTVNNSEIQTSSAVITGSTTGTLITAQSLTTGSKYAMLIHFNGTAPEPYNSSGITDLYTVATVTNSNTLTLYNASNFTTQGTSTMTITIYTKQNNSIAIGYNTQTTQSNQIVLGNSSNTQLKSNTFVVDITDVPTTGQVLTWQAGGYAAWDTIVGGGGGGSYSFLSPLVNTAGVVSINNAAADGSTKGAASFTAADFNSSSGNISIDYTNGQAASSTLKGFLTAADWQTFNNKISNITGLVTAGTNISITGSGTSGSPYVINASATGITTLNTLTASTQFFAVGTTGTSPSWSVSGGNTHTINIPTTSGTNTGLVTPTMYNNWNAKQDAITGAATTIVSSNLTASRAVVSNTLGKIDVSTATTTDLTNLVAQYTGQTLTDGATITMNCSSGYNGTVTINGSRNITFSNVTNWHPITIKVTQGVSGNYTLTFPANSLIPVGFGSGTTLNLSTAGGAIDVIYIIYDGSNYLVTLAKDFIN